MGRTGTMTTTHQIRFYESIVREYKELDTEITEGYVYDMLCALFKKHYLFDSYSADVVNPWVFSIKIITRGSAGQYSKKSICILQKDGKWGNVSILSCLKHPTHDTLVKNALRSEIHESQIQPLRDAVNPETFICPECGACGCEFHIDHFPTPFKTITEAFISERDLSFGTIALYRDPTTNYWLLSDRELAESWKSYHHTHARLRAICKTCNLSRGTGEKQPKPSHCLIVD